MGTIERKSSRRIIYGSALFTIFIVAVTEHFTDNDADNLGKALLQNVLFKGIVFKGILSMAMTLAVSIFFMDCANQKYYLTDFFSKGAYTAYIIQYLFPIPASFKIFTLILNKTGNIAYDSSGGDDPYDTIYTTNGHLLFPGWLLVSAITLLIVWPLAFAIRSIPGFSQVL